MGIDRQQALNGKRRLNKTSIQCQTLLTAHLRCKSKDLSSESQKDNIIIAEEVVDPLAAKAAHLRF